MIVLVYLVKAILIIFPFIIFFDYNKRHNFFYSFIYVLVFGLTVWIILPWFTATQLRGLYFAMSVPFLMIIYLFIAKKRKDKRRQLKQRADQRVIDDM
jgi:uncharacterized membrane protein YesL